MLVNIDDANGVRTVTLNRPEALNAFNEALYDATTIALRDADADPSVGVILLTGTGRAFSAGNDLVEMQARITDPDFQSGEYGFPGLIDTHLHVESAMVTVARFAEAVLPHGTTTVLIDNHEIANVLGLEGIRWMLEEGRALPLQVLLAVPSCVPALPGFEDAGAVLDAADIREALTWDGVAALGEMMNMPGVYGSDDGTHEMIGAVLDAMANHGVTISLGVPTMYHALLMADLGDRDMSSFRVASCGGAPMPKALIEGFEHKFGVTVLEGFGMSETGAAGFVNRPDARRGGSHRMPPWGGPAR